MRRSCRFLQNLAPLSFTLGSRVTGNTLRLLEALHLAPKG